MLNRIVIMGRMTSDPELRRTGSGIAVASFAVACERDFGGKDQEKETDFIDCVAWRQTGEFVSKYFKKGSMIIVSGRLQIRSWTDKEGGKRRTAEVLADHVYFGESKAKSEQHSYEKESGTNNAGNYYQPPASAPAASYNAYNTQPADDFAMMDDDDADLPF